jgi:hypothetical protein
MIYSYNKIKHKITGFHWHICYVFEQIFKLDLASYDVDKLIHPDFRPIVVASKVRLENPLKEIVLAFHNLPDSAKIQLQDAFLANNDIACLSDNSKYLVPYEALHEDIVAILKPFFTSLWEEYPLVIAMETDFGTVKSHYESLAQNIFVCPFCGLESFETPEDDYREAYDHYYAKSKYPFISVNFDLLFPTCHKCNSKEKKALDILYCHDGTRRLAYNPYDDKLCSDELEVQIIKDEKYNNHTLITLLKSVPWNLELRRNAKIEEEIVTWDSIYGIKKRYSNRLRHFETEWFNELLDNYKDSLDDKVDFEKFKKRQLKKAKFRVLNSTNGILLYSYFKFLLESENIEKRLYQCARKTS